jgi:hypothetical protein
VTRADLAAGIAPLVVPAGATYVLDTDQGSMFDVTNGNAPIRLVGPGVKDGVFYRSDDQNRAFFAVQSLMVSEGAILRGVGTRALILIADGPVEIHGILDVSAGHCSSTIDGLGCAGPGGFAAQAGCSPGKRGGSSTGTAGGGGGGGFASPGGAGGAGGAFSIMGGAGGSGTGCLGLDPLHGGSGGAIGSSRPGSAGGGAVQVTSYSSILLATPKVANTDGAWAGGAGGGGGAPGGSGPFAGGGGGAGGTILLEAPVIDIRPGVVLAANGGGGGAGATAIDGQPGQFGSTPASGGSGGPMIANGGAGAALNANATDGATGMMTQQSSPAGGGGGGGIGRIRINAVTLNLSDQAVYSPAPSLNMLPAS